jgi:hypothetical protein
MAMAANSIFGIAVPQNGTDIFADKEDFTVNFNGADLAVIEDVDGRLVIDSHGIFGKNVFHFFALLLICAFLISLFQCLFASNKKEGLVGSQKTHQQLCRHTITDTSLPQVLKRYSFSALSRKRFWGSLAV